MAARLELKQVLLVVVDLSWAVAAFLALIVDAFPADFFTAASWAVLRRVLGDGVGQRL